MISNKIISILLIGALTGCAASAEPQESGVTTAESLEPESSKSVSSESVSSESETTLIETTTESAGEGRNVLVVYYSATGTTATVAGSLAELTGGDIFALEPVEPYSSAELNWRDDNSRVSQENKNPDHREVALVAATVDNWDSYDTVFIGYPIWWGIAAWPVNGFVAANDFTGKTVIPFCTAASSGVGESGQLLEEFAGTGTWLAGERFRSGTTSEELQTWLDGLGL